MGIETSFGRVKRPQTAEFALGNWPGHLRGLLIDTEFRALLRGSGDCDSSLILSFGEKA